MEEGEIFLDELKFAVFDEADNLFEMGYAEDILELEKRFSLRMCRALYSHNAKCC